MPIAKTVEKMKELKPGEVLEILADDEGIKSDMPAWCQATGNELISIEEENGKYRILIRKKGG
jgi:TusA-related sulfurtransferase